MITDLDKLGINLSDQLGGDHSLRDSQITLKNESSFIDQSDLNPNASENNIPKFYHRLGKSEHTKSTCDKIIVLKRG